FGRSNPLTSHFLLSVDGKPFQSVSFLLANEDKLDLTGSTFRFEKARHNNSFYVSALDYTIDPPVVTPIPAALPLFASGLGALGLLGWRRKRSQTQAERKAAI